MLISAIKNGRKAITHRLNNRQDTILYGTVATGFAAAAYEAGFDLRKIKILVFVALSISFFRELGRLNAWTSSKDNKVSVFRDGITDRRQAVALISGGITGVTDISYATWVASSMEGVPHVPMVAVPILLAICVYAGTKYVGGPINAAKIYGKELFDFPRRPEIPVIPPLRPDLYQLLGIEFLRKNAKGKDLGS